MDRIRKYENLTFISENREKQRAYYIPEGGCTSLNGEWDFKFYNCDFEENYTEKEWDKLSVPSCWELYGYEHIKSEYVFQIDGNFGASAAILEALASYWGNTLHLLPCFPDEWKTVHLHGFKIQGGHTIDYALENRVVTELSVIMGYESSAKFEVNGKSVVTSGKCGEEIRII